MTVDGEQEPVAMKQSLPTSVWLNIADKIKDDADLGLFRSLSREHQRIAYTVHKDRPAYKHYLQNKVTRLTLSCIASKVNTV